VLVTTNLSKSLSESSIIELCGITKDPNDEKRSLARCVLTGRTGDGRKDTLKMAHLVPASADEDILSALKLSNDEHGVWSLRNVLIIELEY